MKTHNLEQINAREIDGRHELFALRPNRPEFISVGRLKDFGWASEMLV